MQGRAWWRPASLSVHCADELLWWIFGGTASQNAPLRTKYPDVLGDATTQGGEDTAQATWKGRDGTNQPLVALDGRPQIRLSLSLEALEKPPAYGYERCASRHGEQGQARRAEGLDNVIWYVLVSVEQTPPQCGGLRTVQSFYKAIRARITVTRVRGLPAFDETPDKKSGTALV
jgi:hypothetical protein